jgi:AI-2E family transporter
VVQQIDNHIISPNMIGRTVRLHPVTVMLGLLVGGTLLGLWGMLLAIPVIAVVKILVLHAWDTRMTWPPPSSGEPAEERAVVPEGPMEPDRPEEQRPSRAPQPWWGAVRTLFGGRRTEEGPPARLDEPRDGEHVAEAPPARRP